MPVIKYKKFKFRERTLEIINLANDIIDEYQAEGYELTLRQLYYQFVARDIIPNTQAEYNKLGTIVNKSRLAGLTDWNAIIDRTRSVEGNSHWDSPAEIIKSCASYYRIDTRATQDTYLEVWVEKDALVGVVERACTDLDIKYLSCRGYVSQSAMWRAAQRFENVEDLEGKQIILLHFGDHDPSGIDMTRDIQDRLDMFRVNVQVERIALNMEQIEKYNPPPNPAKLTDSRCESYIEQHGTDSWELDALDPRVITDLIVMSAEQYTDHEARAKLLIDQKNDRKKLRQIANNL